MNLIFEVIPMAARGVKCYVDPDTGRYTEFVRYTTVKWSSKKEVFIKSVLSEFKRVYWKWEDNAFKAPLEMNVYLVGAHAKRLVYQSCYLSNQFRAARYYGILECMNRKWGRFE